MSDPAVEELLEDARLVINYAVRLGRLPDNTLLAAVAALRSVPSTRDIVFRDIVFVDRSE
jgi:hypothetical protein